MCIYLFIKYHDLSTLTLLSHYFISGMFLGIIAIRVALNLNPMCFLFSNSKQTCVFEYPSRLTG